MIILWIGALVFFALARRVDNPIAWTVHVWRLYQRLKPLYKPFCCLKI